MDRLCPSDTSRLAQVVLVPVGQAQPVLVGQAYWNRLCLSHWHRQAGCTKPVPLGLGEVERDLSLCHGTSHIPMMEAFPCAMAQALYHDGACTCSTCANLCHKVGLPWQDRAMFLHISRAREKVYYVSKIPPVQEGTGTWPDYCWIVMIKKMRGHSEKKTAPKSRNNCRVNGRGCGCTGTVDSRRNYVQS